MATEFSTSDPTLVPNNGAEPEEDEEHWLYGDETKKQSGENVAGFLDANQESYLSNTNEKQAAEKAAKSGEDDDNDESDSDDDDDVKVTIGNIKTGAPSYMAPPMNLSLKSGRSYGVTAPAKLQSKGIDMEAVGSINGLPVVEVDIDIFEDKPWRKPGADLSDYFNYGFNEETWKAYCEKQRRLQLGLEPGAPLNSENKITVQQGRSAVLEKEIESAAIKSEFKMDFLPSANILPAANRLKAGPPPNRKLGGTIDVIGGQTGAIRRVEGRRREIHEHNPIQVLGDHAGKTPPFAPPAGLPPPPIGAPPPHFLHPPPPVSGMPPPLHPPGIPPPAIPGLFPPPLAPPPTLMMPPMDGRCPTTGYNPRAPPPFGYNSGDSTFISYPPVSASHSPWVTPMEKGGGGTSPWEYQGSRRDPERERERERDRTPTTSEYSNEDERYHYYSHEREYEREFHHGRERSRERDERHRDRRHRDKEESGKHKSSKRKQHDGEEGDGHRRHKHKKSKRSKEEKEAPEEAVSHREEPEGKE
ncbi:pre-mRNA 3'-end-processing factor FIP1-like isoform X1 [Paramormyrops kingsleyae]|uniref:Pre-mRNA 3'-end-processing factor FIP1-like n=2 Tax=Paramormyrops kingsleyae TaxID=1676925 RepID=A0A3B3SXG8_9TELE|nr:pre-mRNA 3'-end-processing factor FIP1-like isoform X1 [Paramormyrops kingsleyae]